MVNVLNIRLQTDGMSYVVDLVAVMGEGKAYQKVRINHPTHKVNPKILPHLLPNDKTATTQFVTSDRLLFTQDIGFPVI